MGKPMKKFFVLLSVMLFISVHGTSVHGTDLGDFNIFTDRMIVLDPIENLGESDDDFLVEALTEQLRLLLVKAPFIALTDRERTFLITLSMDEEYAEDFSQTDGSIRYRLKPHVQIGPADATHFPLHVTGGYRILSGEGEASGTQLLEVRIDVHNNMTDSDYDQVVLSGSFGDFIHDPQEFFFPFLSRFLRYTIYRIHLSSEPADAFIWVDDQFAGIGSTSNIIVTPGLHRITVSRDGYREYRDLVQVSRDGFTKHVILQPQSGLTQYNLTTTPDGVSVFLDVDFIGSTPLSVSVGPNNSTLTLSKEGYRTESIIVADLPSQAATLHVNLLPEALQEELNARAERQLKWAKGLSYAGIGLLISSIFFGIQKTSKQQEADLYGISDPDRAADAQAASNTYNSLLISSLILSGGVFTVSFIKTVQYFNTYNRLSDYAVPIVSAEVAF
jgi:hypothetical protein